MGKVEQLWNAVWDGGLFHDCMKIGDGKEGFLVCVAKGQVSRKRFDIEVPRKKFSFKFEEKLVGLRGAIADRF